MPKTLAIQRHTDNNGGWWLEITQADSHVMFGDELLNEIVAHPQWFPHIRLEKVEHQCDSACRYLPSPVCFRDWLIHVFALNRVVVYRFGIYDWEYNAWEASWPE